jgi:hypothetical protein
MSKVIEQTRNSKARETDQERRNNDLPQDTASFGEEELPQGTDPECIERPDSPSFDDDEHELEPPPSGSCEALTLHRDMTSVDGDMINAYLVHEPPLHIRRTLDQFYYLGMDSTEERDEDQVVAKPPLSEMLKDFTEGGDEAHNVGELPDSMLPKRFQNFAKRKDLAPSNVTQGRDGSTDPNIIMVDQLWLWIIDQGRAPTNGYLYFEA